MPPFNSPLPPANSHRPLLVHVTQDDELSSFERTTIRYGRIGFFVGGLSVIAAFAGAHFVLQELKEMAAQTDLLNIAAHQARVDSNEAAKSANAQLRILQGQLKEQRDALVLDQRAWVTFAGVDIRHFEPGRPIDIGINFKNVGKTPALNVRYRVFAGRAISNLVGDDAVIAELSHLKTTTPKFLQAPIAPEETKSLPYLMWSPQYAVELPAVKAGFYSFYVHGKLSYLDIFNHPQWITFCFRLYYTESGPAYLTCQDTTEKVLRWS